MALHLLLGCPSCSAKVKKMTRPAPLIEVKRSVERNWDLELFDRALARLSDLQRPAQELYLNGVAGLKTPEFVEWLSDKSRRAVVWDPEEAVRLGRLGVLASEGLDVNSRGLAAMRMGQALRRARGDYLGADTWFEKSRNLLEQQGADPLLLAKLLRLQGYSRFVQSRSEEALPLFGQAAEIYLAADDLEGVGKTLADQAAAMEEVEGSEAAIQCLMKACCYIDFEQNPRFALMIAQSLSLYHANLGNTDVAVSYLDVARQLLEEQGSAPADALRMDWSAGRILAQAGRASESVTLFSRARDGFVGLGLAAEAGQISLDLALSLLALGRSSELKELAQEMLPIFRSRLLHREALAALEFFRTAVISETITAAQIHAVAEFLAELESNGKARFRRPT
jgi:tetratricopeptide (TPR) repeat protein